MTTEARRHFRKIEARYRLGKMRLKKLAASGQDFFEFHDRDGRQILVHRSTRVPGTWQTTWFDLDGEPAGHAERKILFDALMAAREYGAVIVPEGDAFAEAEKALRGH